MGIFQPLPVANLMGGWCPDLPLEELKPGQFNVATNVRFYNGRIEKVRGWTTQPSTVSGVPGLICRARFQDGTDVPIICTDRNVYQMASDFSVTALNAAPYAAPVAPFTSSIRWETASFPSAFFLNRRDGALKIQKWNESLFGDIDNVGFGTIVGTPPKGQSMDTYKDHLGIGAITDDGNGNIGLQSVALSDLAANAARGENNWAYGDPASEAVIEGFFSGNDNVRRVLRMGDYYMVYKESEIDTLVYTSGTFIYLNQEPITYTGTPSPSGIIGVRGIHYALFNDGFYRCNGADIEQIGQNIYQTFLAVVMPDNPEDLWAWHDQLRFEIVWVGQNNNAVVFNYDTNSWSLRLFPFSAAGYVNLTENNDDWNSRTQDWNQYLEDWFNVDTLDNLSILAGSNEGDLYTLYQSNVYTAGDSTEQIQADVQTGAMDFGQPGNIKMVNEMRVDGDNVNGTPGFDTPLQLYVSGADTPQLTNWQGPFTCVNNRFTFGVSGRYIRFWFHKPDGYFNLSRFTPFFRQRGRF